MILTPQSWGSPLQEFNRCHTPAGSPKGGQFCSEEQAQDAAAPHPAMPSDRSSFTDEEMAALAKRREASSVWDRQISAAVSTGAIPPLAAKRLGWYSKAEHEGEYRDPELGWKPLPETLYHVTTGAEGVLRKGLLSRADLEMRSGRGLGGGDDTSISFTEDLKIARAIRAGILDARRVARGELTIPMMFAQAKASPLRSKEREGSRSQFEILVSLQGGGSEWRMGQPLPEGLRLLLKGYKSVSGHSEPDKSALAGVRSGGAYAVKSLPPGYLPRRTWKGRDERFTSNLIRKMTPAEHIEAAFEFFKRASLAREIAGGRIDPLFFATDPAALAKVRPRDIRIMRFTPRRGAKGYRMSGLGEWRTHSGRAVRYAGLVEAR